MKFNFEFDGIKSICTIQDKNNTFTGIAVCHEDDMDMVSEITGSFIAESRALIKRLQHIKNNEIKPELKALKNLQKSFIHSPYFNPYSMEYKTLKRQIQIKEEELSVIKDDIETEKQYLKQYLQNKDILFNKIRKKNKSLGQ